MQWNVSSIFSYLAVVYIADEHNSQSQTYRHIGVRCDMSMMSWLEYIVDDSINPEPLEPRKKKTRTTGDDISQPP